MHRALQPSALMSWRSSRSPVATGMHPVRDVDEGRPGVLYQRCPLSNEQGHDSEWTRSLRPLGIGLVIVKG